jgi:hypothetical protein
MPETILMASDGTAMLVLALIVICKFAAAILPALVSQPKRRRRRY